MLNSANRIVITEDDDLDLDALLAGDAFSGENPTNNRSGPDVATEPHVPACSAPPSGNVAPSVDTSPKCDKKNAVISAVEEEVVDDAHWINPLPAAPGDYLATSIHRVPSKSILKKTTSYGSFGLDSSLSSSQPKMPKRSSYLSFTLLDTLNISNQSRNSRQMPVYPDSPGAVGLDLDGEESASTGKAELQQTISVDTADRAAGSVTFDASVHSGDLSSSSSSKMKRNVSFNLVAVREYDRIIGDNPSCRSGPPLSLDWSYSKKSVRSLDDYELERSCERAPNSRLFHMNKWKRKNILSFHWGHSEEEMKEARRKTRHAQFQRSVTKALLPLYIAQEGYISLKRMISRRKDTAGLSDESLTGSSMHSNKSSTQCSAAHHLEIRVCPSPARTA